MKTYKYNKKIEWYKKVEWLDVIIWFIVASLITFAAFYLISNGKEVAKIINLSLFVGELIALGSALNDLFENKNLIILSDKENLSYIEIQDKKKNERFITYLDYKDMLKENTPEQIFNNIENFAGVAKGTIVKVEKIKEKRNKIIFTAQVKAQEWKLHGKISITGVELIENEYEKKFVITKDFEEYDQIKKMIKKKMK